MAASNICLETFNKLRKLPCCSHRFCEKCLIRYVADSKLKVEEDNPGKFPGKVNDIYIECPICREKHSGPRANQGVTEWVQTFSEEVNSFEKGKGKMEETQAELCGGCKESNNKNSKAERFCYECREYFCLNCCDFIHKIKSFKDHRLLMLDADIGLGNGVTEKEIRCLLVKSMTCERHPDKTVAFLSTRDDRLSCVTCAIQDSSKGEGVLEVTQFATKEKNDIKADKLISEFDKLATLSEQIITKKNEAESIEKEESNTVIDEIRRMRQKANDLFDSLEANVSQQCRAATKGHKISEMEDVETIKEIMRSIKVAKALLNAVKQDNHTEVAYAVNNNVEKTLSNIKVRVIEMVRNCKQYGFVLNVEEVLERFLEVGINGTENLAYVTETACPVSFQDCLDKLVVENRPVFAIKNCNVIIEGSGPLAFYTGVACLPDSRFILVDNGKHNCVLISALQGFKVLTSCAFVEDAGNEPVFQGSVAKVGKTYNEFNGYAPSSVAYLHNGFIAISVSGRKKIYFLTDEGLIRIRYELETQLNPFTLFGLKIGDLAVAWKDPWAFGIMSLTRNGEYEENNHIEHDSNGRIFKTFRFVAVDEKRKHIVQPCIVDQAVYCFDYQGNAVYKYTHDKLIFPQGVAVDSRGNAFVCDSETACVHVISHTGNALCVLCEGGALYWPVAIAFDDVKSEFIVTHGGRSKQVISIYQLEYEHE